MTETASRSIYLRQLKSNDALISFSAEEINALDLYAIKLENQKLPVIFDVGHLSKFVGYDLPLLYSIANKQDAFYRSFSISKRDGSERLIKEPLPTLKEIQKIITNDILKNIEISKASKAFSPKSTIKKNARIHLRQRTIVKVDVKDFFHSIKEFSVFNIFYELGYTRCVAMLLARLCTLDGCLPQGAPTSPYISNIFCRRIDDALLAHCVENNFRYTRYADDITISGNEIPKSIISLIRSEIRLFGLKLNKEKTKYYGKGSQKIVTGLAVNEKLQVPREMRREFRKNVHFIRTYGVDGHISRIFETRRNYIKHLIGVGSFICWVNGNDQRTRSDLNFLRGLETL
jgi:RNA-directed DNA polymerase